MAEQKTENMGGTMRLGAIMRPKTGSHAFNAYGSAIEDATGTVRIQQHLPRTIRIVMVATGKNLIQGWWKSRNPRPSVFRCLAIPPEYASTVETPHPLFTAFVKAAQNGHGDAKAPAVGQTAANS